MCGAASFCKVKDTVFGEQCFREFPGTEGEDANLFVKVAFIPLL